MIYDLKNIKYNFTNYNNNNFNLKSVKYTEEKLKNIIKNNVLEAADWSNISVYQDLSEDFIREFKDKICWSSISLYQSLSEDFVLEFIDRISWLFISINRKIKIEYSSKEEFDFFYSHIYNNTPFIEDEIVYYIPVLQNNKKLLQKLIDKNLLPNSIEEYLLI
jgi:hypothetical protein